MRIHASCATRDGSGVLLTGPSGSGKSDLLLRLLDRGFILVADDQVDIEDGQASPPIALRGLLEIRGFGIVKLPFVEKTRLVVSIALGQGERLPEPQRSAHGLPIVRVDPWLASAPQRVALAMDCALGRFSTVAGAFPAW